jgi:hypothetical protein
VRDAVAQATHPGGRLIAIRSRSGDHLDVADLANPLHRRQGEHLFGDRPLVPKSPERTAFRIDRIDHGEAVRTGMALGKSALPFGHKEYWGASTSSFYLDQKVT